MRILHTMIRVGDLDRSLAFYTNVLGMRLLRRNDYPEGRFTLAFVGYGDESDNAVIELTALIAFQNMSSKFNSALDVAPQGFCRLPRK